MQRTPSELSRRSSTSFETAPDGFSSENRATSVMSQHTTLSSMSGDMARRSTSSDEDDRSTLKEHPRSESAALSESSAVTWEGATAM